MNNNIVLTGSAGSGKTSTPRIDPETDNQLKVIAHELAINHTEGTYTDQYLTILDALRISYTFPQY